MTNSSLRDGAETFVPIAAPDEERRPRLKNFPRALWFLPLLLLLQLQSTGKALLNTLQTTTFEQWATDGTYTSAISVVNNKSDVLDANKTKIEQHDSSKSVVNNTTSSEAEVLDDNDKKMEQHDGDNDDDEKAVKHHNNDDSAPICVHINNDVKAMCCAQSWDPEHSLDEWWQRHPGWELVLENTSTYCFGPIQFKRRRDFIENVVYPLQWQTNCTNVTSEMHVSSGLSGNVGMWMRQFVASMRKKMTFSINKHRLGYRWLYSKINETHDVCESSDAECFFLPISNCKAPDATSNQAKFSKCRLGLCDENPWLRHYLLRPNYVLRKRTFQVLQEQELVPKLPCAAVHIRRTDATLENWANKRNYFEVNDYVKGLREGGKEQNVSSVILLTDDQSAIDEANEFHPNIPWMYINRTRCRGTECGYNAHMPSKDPMLEMAIIMAEMRLTRKCNLLVCGESGYRDLIRHSMFLEQGDRPDDHVLVQIDRGRQPNRHTKTGNKTAEDFFKLMEGKRLKLKHNKGNRTSK